MNRIPSVGNIETIFKKMDSDQEKLIYLLNLKKEIARVIYSFKNTILLKYKNEGSCIEFNRASDLAKFIEDLNYVIEEECCEELNNKIIEIKKYAELFFLKTSYYKGFYSKDIFEDDDYEDDVITFGVMDLGVWVEKELKSYELIQNYILTEIDFLGQKQIKLNNSNMMSSNNFKKLADELTEKYFNNEELIMHLKNLNEKEENEFIKFLVKKYKRRTIQEWMKHYELEERIRLIANIQSKKFDPLTEGKNLDRINNSNFCKSTLGIMIKDNLKSFEEKYVNEGNKKNEIKNYDDKQENHFNDNNPINDRPSTEISNKKKEIPTRGLKRLAKDFCEILIKEKNITEVLIETKKNNKLSKLIINKLEEEYYLKESNKRSIADYFRKLDLEIKKEKNGNLVVIDNYKRI